MTMFSSPEFKVGMLVVMVAGLIGVMSLKVAEGPGLLTGTNDYWFEVDNAGGLVKSSSVKMAGIKVGIIENIELVKGRARVHLQLEKSTPITAGSRVELRADGILGDKHVELYSSRLGEASLPSGSQIMDAKSASGLDSLVEEVGKVTDSLAEVAQNLNKATKGGDDSTTLGRIVLNIEKLTKDLADITGDNKEKLNEIIDQIHGITMTLDEVVNDEGPDGFRSVWQRASNSMARIERSMENVEQITEKVNNGEGTIGRLINDEETVDGINTAINNVNDFLGGVGTLETSIDFHSEYLTELGEAKSFASIKIRPGLDRYYELGIVDDPRGVVKTESVEVKDNLTGSPTSDTTTVKNFSNDVKFTALFAKRFYDITVKGGIIESSGGFGVDYHMLRDKLMLSTEFFRFGDTYARAFLRYNFAKGVYVVGGGDDVFDKDDANGFVGAGVFITNDDLKMLASKLPF